MYSQAAITTLEERIGFGPGDTSLPEVTESHILGTSGRTLPFFHKLATLKNIYNTVEKPNMNATEFNAFLQLMKENAVRQVLSAVLDKHKEYRPEHDYSELIINRPAIFDDAIGYVMASTVVEQLIATSRSNYIESSAKLSYQQLKMENDGVVDDNGRIRVKGLKREQFSAINAAADAIFKVTGVFGIFNASDIW